MPFVNIKVAGELSLSQKKEISMRISKTLEDVAGKKPGSTYIVFEEVDRENWAVGGALLSEM